MFTAAESGVRVHASDSRQPPLKAAVRLDSIASLVVRRKVNRVCIRREAHFAGVQPGLEPPS